LDPAPLNSFKFHAYTLYKPYSDHSQITHHTITPTKASFSSGGYSNTAAPQLFSTSLYEDAMFISAQGIKAAATAKTCDCIGRETPTQPNT
jgi:hypothetical protein